MARSFSAAFNTLIVCGTGSRKKTKQNNSVNFVHPFRGFISTFCVRRIRFNLWTFRTRGEVLMAAANDKPFGFYVCTRSFTGGAQWKISVFAKTQVFASRYSRNPRLRYLRRNQTRLSVPRECQRICSHERKISGVYA